MGEISQGPSLLLRLKLSGSVESLLHGTLQWQQKRKNSHSMMRALARREHDRLAGGHEEGAESDSDSDE